MFVFDADSDNITTSQTEGAFTIEQVGAPDWLQMTCFSTPHHFQLQQAMSAAREASRGVIDFYRQSIRRKLSKVSPSFPLTHTVVKYSSFHNVTLQDAKFTALNIAV